MLRSVGSLRGCSRVGVEVESVAEVADGRARVVAHIEVRGRAAQVLAGIVSGGPLYSGNCIPLVGRYKLAY